MRDQEYVVKLKKKERVWLEGVLRKGKTRAQLQTRARILLHADRGRARLSWSNERIAEAVCCCPALCGRVRKQYVEHGLDAVLTRKKRETPPVPPIFDGEKEARLIQLACSPPPEGHAGWSLRLLADKVVELKIVDHAGRNTIGNVLKKTNSSRILKSNGSSRRNPTPLS